MRLLVRSVSPAARLMAIVVVGAVAISAAACSSDSAPRDGARFRMGSPATEAGRDDDEALHAVTLTRAFEIMETEVTQGSFREVLGYDPSFFPRVGASPENPVEQVSWYDALAYANELSQARGYPRCTVLSGILCADGSAGNERTWCKTNGGIGSAEVALDGAASAYECEGYRLPAEAEWEYAARAGTKTAFTNGEITYTSCAPLDPNLDPIGWYCGNSGSKATHLVGTKAANGWGLRDMHGNVAEWTWDGYLRAITEDAVDPEGPRAAAFRVVRGGAAWYHGAAHCRSAERTGFRPGYRDKHLGFRLARTTGTATGQSRPVPFSLSGRSPAPSPASTSSSSFSPSSSSAGAERAPSLDRALPRSPSPSRPRPRTLPFDFTRPDVGAPLTPAEVSAFTRKITGFWREVGFFDWLLRVSHGMSETNPRGMPDFKLFWQDTRALKSGGAVTFEHTGFADNLTIGMSKVFNAAAAGYLASGNARLGRLVEQFAKGYEALFLGMSWDVEDPEEGLLARAIFPPDNSYTEDGRSASVVYGRAKHEVIDWNAQTIPNPTNPYFGDIWVRSWRSKDDVPHIYRAVPLLERVAEEGRDAPVREAAGRAADLLRSFARDVVDTGWYIRSKDRYGNALVPLNPNGMVADLASYVEYSFILPNAECNPKLASALIAYGDTRGVDCGDGYGDPYEYFAEVSHYYNYAIIRYFHAAAVSNALMAGQNEVARALLEGLAARVDGMMSGTQPHSDDPAWPSESASYLVVAAASGLPLTSAETRRVVDQFSRAADHYGAWPNWDLWAPAVPDGEVSWTPSSDGALGRVMDVEEMAYVLEYCESPFRNSTGATFADCAIVLDPEKW